MVTLLCDADIVAYKAAANHQSLTERKPGCFTLYASGPRAIKQVDNQIRFLMDRLDADRVIMVLSDRDNFRKKVLPSYKAQRSGMLRPLSLGYVRDHIVRVYETLHLPWLEGDDLIGILSTGNDYIEGDKIVVSIDKDMQTVPGTLYNPNKDTVWQVTETEANYYHLYQTLVGDACDGYKGCPGVGPVGARKLLEGLSGVEAWAAVVDAYTMRGFTEDDALTQARCARILRNTDYDWERREVKLWTPPTKGGE
jgi:DNA polymerase-1